MSVRRRQQVCSRWVYKREKLFWTYIHTSSHFNRFYVTLGKNSQPTQWWSILSQLILKIYLESTFCQSRVIKSAPSRTCIFYAKKKPKHVSRSKNVSYYNVNVSYYNLFLQSPCNQFSIDIAWQFSNTLQTFSVNERVKEVILSSRAICYFESTRLVS